MAAEDRARGSVAARVYLDYLLQFGGFLLALVVITSLSSTIGYVGNDWWLAYWSSDAGGYSVGYYIGIYASITVSTILLVFVLALGWAVGGVRASASLHAAMLRRVLRSPMSFFDSTPLGR